SLLPDRAVRSRAWTFTSVRDFDPLRAFTLTRDLELSRELAWVEDRSRELVLALALERDPLMLCEPARLSPDFWSPDLPAWWFPALPPLSLLLCPFWVPACAGELYRVPAIT